MSSRRGSRSAFSLRLFSLLLVILLVGLSRPFMQPPVVASREPVTIQFLSVSDWHAQLDPISVPDASNVGGAAVLSSYWKADRLANPNTLTLTAGDSYGASPPLSALFGEEPAVQAMNLMGINVDTFGNHNFDRGTKHLQRMVDLSGLQYVSANLRNLDENVIGVKPYTIFDVGGVKVAVIGITNPEAPTLVFPGRFGTVIPTDPVEAAMRSRSAAAVAGAQVFVAITHLGVDNLNASTGAATGPLIDFANGVHGFDVIFGDHTDVQYQGFINGALVLENRSKGLTYARTKLIYDPLAGQVMHRSTEFVIPISSAVEPDPAIVEFLAPYRRSLASANDEVVGLATGEIVRGDNIERLQEVAIGNLIADALRLRYGSQLAFVNGGSIRAPLPSSYAPADRSLRRTATGYTPGTPYDLVVGDIFAVLPFGNSVVTRTVTGTQVHAMSEHSVAPIPSANGRFAQISGFRFTYDSSRREGSRLVSVTLDDGTPVLPDETVYTLATTDFVNAGGDGYTMLLDGQGVTREVVADVLLDYIRAQKEIAPATDGRIVDISQR